MKTYELIVSGRVQGVGYRNYVQQNAKSLNINGTVRNLSDGNVKVIAQTDDATVQKLVQNIKVPQHHFMKIDNISIKEIPLTKDYDSFTVVY